MRTQYIVELSPNAGLNPPIMTYFKTIPEGSYSYNHYKLRHPGGIYNLTTTRLITSISNLIEKLNGTETSVDIYNYLRLVLYDLFKFYDSCYEIIQCFTHPLTPPEGFINKWLKKNGYKVGELFYDSIKNDDDFLYLRDLYNELKHSGNEIRYLQITNGEQLIWGYWLQVGDGDNGVFPKDSTTTSINFELRRIQYLIYKISANLQEALIIHLKDVHGVDWKPDTTNLDDKFYACLQNTVTRLPELFFYNEAGKAFWKSTYNQGATPSLIFDPVTIDKDILDADYYKDREIKGSQNDSGDDFTRKFAFPHLGLAQTRKIEVGSTIKKVN